MKFLERGIKMLIISSYPPRQCGIGTFSNDIVNVVNRVFGSSLPIEICALQNEDNKLKYGKEVKYVLNALNINEYRTIAERINNRKDIGLVVFQHEFGLYGGDYGDFILAFLLTLNKPIVTFFHTVLPNPDEIRKKVVKGIVNLSNRIIVLTYKSEELLINIYNCQKRKIKVIPHGTHVVLWEQKEKLKSIFQYTDKIVLSTFGLISENKNIETVLYALPEIIEKYPEIIYLIIGKTHPEIIKNEGEKYRNKLINIVKEYHLEKNVAFIDEYLDLKKLLNYLELTDIYLFSSKDPNQAVSGTFAYAMSCGCAVVSTPIPHAIETIQEGNGILLNEFENSKEFQKAIVQLIENKQERIEMGRRAYTKSHESTWENIAIKYGLLFGELTDRIEDLRFSFPPIKLSHFKELTTNFGMLQFSNFSKPDPASGYTLDDNARALIAIIMYHQIDKNETNLKLTEIYLKFIEHMQRKSGWFDNFIDFNHHLTDGNKNVDLQDANGRALWSLGFLISQAAILPEDFLKRATVCWNKAVKMISEYTAPRAIAYALKGLYYYYIKSNDEFIKRQIERLADNLLEYYHINSEENWCWYEDYMTYANNVLPEAMMYSFLATKNKKYKKIALITFDFILSHYFMKGQLKVISNRGWFKKKNERVFYGEQPIEVATTISALDMFYEVTGNKKYKDQLEVAFAWFLGNNHLKQIMYNPVNGASYDGLEDKNININQGAESTICFLKAQIIMQKYASKVANISIIH